MTKEVKVLVPNYINEDEKQKYIINYLNEGYVVKNVYNYDADYDVYILEK